MVFTSVPGYLDPPNWNQQSQQPGSSGIRGGSEAQHIQPVVPPRQPEGGMKGSVRPGPMAGRACLAKGPPSEPAPKCPRCDSTNTKFCYFNNYSFSQPRHFCKTCRRYWTRGGALRNVPVGGGCRRNKRSKSGSSSKNNSGNSASDRHGRTTTAEVSSVGGGSGGIPSHIPPPPQLSFNMACLHPFADYRVGGFGLSFGGIQPIDALDHQMGSSSSIGLEQWSLHHQAQQFPFLAGLGLETPAPPPSLGLYPFDGEVSVDGQIHGKPSSSCGLISQLASVKMEENHPQGLSLPRHYLGVPVNLPRHYIGNDHYWSGGGGGGGGGDGSGGGWTHLSGFNSSSNGSIL